MTATRTPVRRPVVDVHDDPAAVTAPLTVRPGPATGRHRAPAVASPRRSRRWPAVTATVLAVLAVLAVVAGAYLIGSRSGPATVAATPAAAATPAIPAPPLPTRAASVDRSLTPEQPSSHRAQPPTEPTCLSAASAQKAYRTQLSTGETVQRVSGLRCDGAWAVALVDVTAAGSVDTDGTPLANAVTGVFHWTAGSWHAIDRTTVCPGTAVPAGLRDLACNSN